jgi:hypothetical protein
MELESFAELFEAGLAQQGGHSNPVVAPAVRRIGEMRPDTGQLPPAGL